jgi:hypothetical protein
MNDSKPGIRSSVEIQIFLNHYSSGLAEHINLNKLAYLGIFLWQTIAHHDRMRAAS